MRFYVVFSEEDRAQVDDLDRQFEALQHDLVIDEGDEAGVERLAEADGALLVITPMWNTRAFLLRYIAVLKSRKPIVAIRIKTTDFPPGLTDQQIIDVTDMLDSEPDIQALLNALQDRLLERTDDIEDLTISVDDDVFGELVNLGGNINFANSTITITKQYITPPDDESDDELEVLDAPQAPAADESLPDAENLTATTPQSATATDTEKKEPTRRVWRTVGILAGFIASAIGLVSGVLGIVQYVQYVQERALPTATPLPVPTAVLTRIPSTDFAVIVAGLGFRENRASDSDDAANENTDENTDENAGVIKSDDAADIIAGYFLSEIRQFVPEVFNVVSSWEDPGISHILGQTVEEREIEARTLGERLGADIVIYGVVEQEPAGVFSIFYPEFYFSTSLFVVDPELVGSGQLGEPVRFLTDVPQPQPVIERVEMTRYFIEGLKQFLVGDYALAEASFVDAIESVESTKGLEILYIYAGNAASRQDHDETALTYWTDSLQHGETYSRGLSARGVGLAQIANNVYKEELNNGSRQEGQTPPASALASDATCTDDVPLDSVDMLLETAQLCYDEALKSADFNQQLRTKIQLGRLHYWRSLNKYSVEPLWVTATQHFTDVLEMFDSVRESPEDAVVAYWYAAEANFWLGYSIRDQDFPDCAAIEQALAYLNEADSLYDYAPQQEMASEKKTLIDGVIAEAREAKFDQDCN